MPLQYGAAPKELAECIAEAHASVKGLETCAEKLFGVLPEEMTESIRQAGAALKGLQACIESSAHHLQENASVQKLEREIEQCKGREVHRESVVEKLQSDLEEQVKKYETLEQDFWQLMEKETSGDKVADTDEGGEAVDESSFASVIPPPRAAKLRNAPTSLVSKLAAASSQSAKTPAVPDSTAVVQPSWTAPPQATAVAVSKGVVSTSLTPQAVWEDAEAHLTQATEAPAPKAVLSSWTARPALAGKGIVVPAQALKRVVQPSWTAPTKRGKQ